MNRLVLGLGVVVVGLLLWLVWPKGSTTQTAQAGPPSVVPVRPGPKLVFADNQAPQQPAQSPDLSLNATPLADIKPSMVDAVVQQNGVPVIVFVDGSQLPVDPATYSQLSPDVRFRLDYKRGGP